MFEFIDTAFQWLLYGLKGIGGLLAITGGIAIAGAGIAVVFAVVAQFIIWPVFLVKHAKAKKTAVS